MAFESPGSMGGASSRLDPERASLVDLVLGWGAMVPFVAGAVLAWAAHGRLQSEAMSGAIIWGGAILAFLAGVRRGLSFRTPGGARAGQIAVTLWSFGLAFASMVALQPMTSLGLLILGYGALAALARGAAARAEVPPFFGQLRPLQMGVGTLSLCAVAIRLWLQG